jgi:hypothetical protein
MHHKKRNDSVDTSLNESLKMQSGLPTARPQHLDWCQIPLF